MKKITRVFLFLCLIVLLALGQKCFGQCPSSMSIYIPPREDADSVKKVDSVSKAEAVFYFTKKEDILYIFSGMVREPLSNCQFLASAPIQKTETLKKKLLEPGGEEKLFSFFGTTFHCVKQWEEYFDAP